MFKPYQKKPLKLKSEKVQYLNRISEKKMNLMKSIATKYNITNKRGKVDWREVNEVVKFYEEYIVKYCEQEYMDKALLTPIGTFRPSLGNIKILVKMLRMRFSTAANKYINWYNSFRDNISNIIRSPFISNFELDCIDEFEVPEKYRLRGTGRKAKPIGEKRVSYKNKIITIIVPEYLSMEGLVTNDENDVLEILLFDINKRIYLKPKHVVLK